MISLLLICARLCLNDFNSVAINSGYLKLFSRQLVEITTTICSVKLSKSDCLICMTAEIIAQWILRFASVFSGINFTNLIKLALIIIWYLGSNCDFPRKKKKSLRRSAAIWHKRRPVCLDDHTVPAQFAVFRGVGSQTLCLFVSDNKHSTFKTLHFSLLDSFQSFRQSATLPGIL